MTGAGVDQEGEVDGAVQAADVVVTMGCGDAWPVYPGRFRGDLVPRLVDDR